MSASIESSLWIGVVTLFPQMLAAITTEGVVARGLARGALTLELFDLRAFSKKKHRSVDDRPYGGGAGMVLAYPPLKAAIRAARARAPTFPWVIYLTPQGPPLTQRAVEYLAQRRSVVLVCGRYEGIDERVVQMEIDELLSVGDYVLSGGELPAMVAIDAMARVVPGVLGDPRSACEESFSMGLLEYPHYTRPSEVDHLAVPAPLLSGHHAEIAQWRSKAAWAQTTEKRPGLLELLK